MKNFLLLALAAVAISLSAPSHTYAQDEDFDNELLEESEELPPPTQNLDNEITAPPEPSSGFVGTQRFRPAPRFWKRALWSTLGAANLVQVQDLAQAVAQAFRLRRLREEYR